MKETGLMPKEIQLRIKEEIKILGNANQCAPKESSNVFNV
jgi:hypothetical protein